jgi:hypothetical protein
MRFALNAGNGSVGETQEEDTADGTEDNAEDGEVWQDNFRLEYVLQPPPASRPDLRGTPIWLACAEVVGGMSLRAVPATEHQAN